MRIDESVSLANETPSVIVEHEGKTLVFSISHYRRNRFQAGYKVFSQINAYWADQSPQNQQAIFDIYNDIYTAFDEVFTREGLREVLQQKVELLLTKYHDLEDIARWIAFRADDIKVPASVPSEFVADVDRNMSVGKTYIAADYKRLTALALALRCMVPIWGEYISSIRQNVDDNFKEMMAFQLADRVFTREVPAIKKLMDYIENNIGSDNTQRPVGVFKGIPTPDYPRWLLSLIMIQCLAIGDIRGANPDAHLVTYIHMFIVGKLSPKDDFGDSKIKDKEISDDRQDESNAGSSALERYKVKANISTGDLVEMEHFLSDLYRTARYLAPGIDPNEVRLAVERVEGYIEKPTAPQTTLLAWVLEPIVSPRSVLYHSAELVKNLLAVAEAVLWHRGHHYLSVLITCRPITSEKEMIVSPVDSKQRIPEPLIERLNELYPYFRNQRNKRQQTKDSNLAMESIDILTNNFMVFGWQPLADPNRIEQILGYKTKRFPVQPDIKMLLARLCIEVQTRSYLPPT